MPPDCAAIDITSGDFGEPPAAPTASDAGRDYFVPALALPLDANDSERRLVIATNEELAAKRGLNCLDQSHLRSDHPFPGRNAHAGHSASPFPWQR